MDLEKIQEEIITPCLSERKDQELTLSLNEKEVSLSITKSEILESVNGFDKTKLINKQQTKQSIKLPIEDNAKVANEEKKIREQIQQKYNKVINVNTIYKKLEKRLKIGKNKGEHHFKKIMKEFKGLDTFVDTKKEIEVMNVACDKGFQRSIEVLQIREKIQQLNKDLYDTSTNYQQMFGDWKLPGDSCNSLLEMKIDDSQLIQKSKQILKDRQSKKSVADFSDSLSSLNQYLKGKSQLILPNEGRDERNGFDSNIEQIFEQQENAFKIKEKNDELCKKKAEDREKELRDIISKTKFEIRKNKDNGDHGDDKHAPNQVYFEEYHKRSQQIVNKALRISRKIYQEKLGLISPQERLFSDIQENITSKNYENELLLLAQQSSKTKKTSNTDDISNQSSPAKNKLNHMMRPSEAFLWNSSSINNYISDQFVSKSSVEAEGKRGSFLASPSFSPCDDLKAELIAKQNYHKEGEPQYEQPKVILRNSSSLTSCRNRSNFQSMKTLPSLTNQISAFSSSEKDQSLNKTMAQNVQGQKLSDQKKRNTRNQIQSLSNLSSIFNSPKNTVILKRKKDLSLNRQYQNSMNASSLNEINMDASLSTSFNNINRRYFTKNESIQIKSPQMIHINTEKGEAQKKSFNIISEEVEKQVKDLSAVFKRFNTNNNRNNQQKFIPFSSSAARKSKQVDDENNFICCFNPTLSIQKKAMKNIIQQMKEAEDQFKLEKQQLVTEMTEEFSNFHKTSEKYQNPIISSIREVNPIEENKYKSYLSKNYKPRILPNF